MDIQNIKLIIWDLDDTLWDGTISEGDVKLNDSTVLFIEHSTDAGVVHSICSKNDFYVIKKKLTDYGLWDYFVFPSVDWTSKGNRVKNIIDTMKLRYVNVLFIDDNIQNLEEVKHFCPGIMTMLPDAIGELYEAFDKVKPKDPNHKRLHQYHLLEKKENSKAEFASNEEFLMSCNISVSIFYDCENQIDRIHDLVIRSNQLNYTKVRSDREELLRLFCDSSVSCGYVSVGDRFGDYGIVGFFALRENTMIHFVFSCRTLGMQIEQYVYMYLGTPNITVIGDVVSPLRTDFLPPWINQDSVTEKENSSKAKVHTGNILLKGPCDMSQMYAFLNCCEHLETEFSYTNEKGILTEGHNHTSQIVSALYASVPEQERILSSCSFFDRKMFNTVLQHKKVDFLVISMLTDGNLGIYRHRETGYEIALCEKCYDLSDKKDEEKFLSGKIFTSGIDFTEKDISEFQQNFVAVPNTDWKKTLSNLDKILAFVGENTKLILLLGSEQQCQKDHNPARSQRHIEHQKMNAAIEQWASSKNNVTLFRYDKYIHSQSDFGDSINHFSKRVYYNLATDLVDYFASTAQVDVMVKSKASLYKSIFLQKLRDFKHTAIGLFSQKNNCRDMRQL